MSKGPRISQEIKDMISYEATTRPNVSRDDLAREIAERARKLGYPAPEHDTLKKMISEYRHSRKPGPEDEPFSLGSLDTWVDEGGGRKRRLIEITSEDIPAVMRVSKIALVCGRRLTVREAKWVARLHHMADDLGDVYSWAGRYARRQAATEAEKQKPGTAEACRRNFDTSITDATLTMTQMEFVVGGARIKAISGQQQVGRHIIDTLPFVERPVLAVPPMKYDLNFTKTMMRWLRALTLQNAESCMVTPLMRKSEVIASDMDKTAQRLEDETRRLEELLDTCETQLSRFVDGPWVFAHWLMVIMDGPGWRYIEFDGREHIIAELCHWVLTRRLIGGREAQMEGTERAEAAFDLWRNPDEREPTQLLEMVGCRRPRHMIDAEGKAGGA